MELFAAVEGLRCGDLKNSCLHICWGAVLEVGFLLRVLKKKVAEAFTLNICVVQRVIYLPFRANIWSAVPMGHSTVRCCSGSHRPQLKQK